MSFLSILLVSSTFYFAYARPNQPEAVVFPPIETLPEVPEAPKVPNTDGNGYVGLPGFLVDMSKILDRYIPTFDPNRDAKKQEEKKKTSDMMGNFFKYWFIQGDSEI